MGAINNIERLPVSQSVAIGPDASDQPIQRVAITGAGGDIQVVAADAVGKIRILCMYLTIKTTAVDVTFESLSGGAVHTALSGAMTPIANTLWNFDWNPHGHFETKANDAFNIHQTGTSQISGWCTFQIVDPTND